MEVQIKNYLVTLGGEVSSRARFSGDQLKQFVREAICCVGYDKAYADKWGRSNTVDGNLVEVNSLITQQSPDIAQGLSGWGDQGIFFGYATPDEEYGYMPKDHAIAKRLCHDLFSSGLGGIDIKTQVVMDGDDITKVIVAIPLLLGQSIKAVRHFVKSHLPGNYKLIINGTGAYTRHSSIADCGTTGRKLVVDFYGGNSRIGGGSPWTKDGSKADLSLNLAARQIAITWAKKMGVPCSCALACCIGHKDVDVVVTDSADNTLLEATLDFDPAVIRHDFGLDTPIFSKACLWGLFGEYQREQAWEQAK